LSCGGDHLANSPPHHIDGVVVVVSLVVVVVTVCEVAATAVSIAAAAVALNVASATVVRELCARLLTTRNIIT
jgi:hypothetical protein